jgi:hypothetical protein
MQEYTVYSIQYTAPKVLLSILTSVPIKKYLGKNYRNPVRKITPRYQIHYILKALGQEKLTKRLAIKDFI